MVEIGLRKVWREASVLGATGEKSARGLLFCRRYVVHLLKR
jgi:hypothetical protein